LASEPPDEGLLSGADELELLESLVLLELLELLESLELLPPSELLEALLSFSAAFL